MKKKVRVYKPTQMAQQGAQVQGQPQQAQQQQQPNPEVLVGVATQSLMQGTPPDELYNALVKQGIEPQIANQIVSQAVELINANQPEPGVEPTNVEDEDTASATDQTQQRNNIINDIIMGEEDDSYLYETNPELLADDTDEQMKCGGSVSKHSFVKNAMKLAKKQVGGQEGGNKADITDTARGDRSMIKPNFLEGIKDTAMDAQLKKQAEMQYDMLMNQNQAPEEMYPMMAQRGGQQRRQDRQMNRFYRNMSNMMPSGGLQGGSGQFNIMNFTGGNPNMQSMQQGMVNPHGISHIDVRKSGLFGRPRQYSIDFFQNQQASTVNNGIPRELPGKSTAGTTTKQTAKPEAKPRKLYRDDSIITEDNPTGTGTGGTGTGTPPIPTTPELETEPYTPSDAEGVLEQSGMRPGYYDVNPFDPSTWAGAMGDLYEQNLVPHAGASIENVERDPKGHVNRVTFIQRDANGRIIKGPDGNPKIKVVRGKEAETAYRDFKKYNRMDVERAFEVPTKFPGHGYTGRDWQQEGLREKPFYEQGLPKMPIPNQLTYYQNGGFLPEYAIAGQISPENIPVQILDKAGNVIGLTTQGKAEKEGLKHRMAPASNTKTNQQQQINQQNYSSYAEYPPLFGGNRRDTRGMGLRDMLYPFNKAVQYAGSWGQQQGPPRDAQGNPYTGSMDNPQLSRIDVTKSGLLGRPKRYTMDFNVPGTTGSGQGIHTGSSPTMYRGSDGQMHLIDNRNINQAQQSPQGITNLADSAGMTDAQYEAQFAPRSGRGRVADFFYNLNRGDRSGLFDKIGARLEPHQNLQFPDVKPNTPNISDQRTPLGPPEFIQHPNVNVQPENLINPDDTSPGAPEFVQHPNVNVQAENLNDPYAPGAPDFMQHPNVNINQDPTLPETLEKKVLQQQQQQQQPIDSLPTVLSGLDPEVLQNYFNNPNIQANVPDYTLEPDSTFQDWQMRNYGINPDVYAQSNEDMFDDSRFGPRERKAQQAVINARNTILPKYTQENLHTLKPNSKEAIQVATDYLNKALSSQRGYISKEDKKLIKDIANLMVTNPASFGQTRKSYEAQGMKPDPRPGMSSYYVTPKEFQRIIKNNPNLANRQEGGELTKYQSLGQITNQCPPGYRKNADGICEQMFTGKKDFGYSAPTSLGSGSELPNPFTGAADTNPITGQPSGAQHFDSTGQQYENKGLQYPGSNPDAFSVDFKNKNMHDVDFESGVNQFNMFANIGAGLLEQRANNKNLKDIYNQTNADNLYASQTGYDRGWYDPNSGLIDEMGFTGLAQEGGEQSPSFGQQFWKGFTAGPKNIAERIPEEFGQGVVAPFNQYGIGRSAGQLQTSGQMPGEETYMSEEQIRQFLADGGEIEFI